MGQFNNPAFVDLDGDGDRDLLTGDDDGDFYYFQNTGTASAPAFAAASSNPFGLTNAAGYGSAPSFGDLDADGDMDLLSGVSFGFIFYFQNTGSASAPAFVAGSPNPFGLADVGQVAMPTFVDLDGDGDLDIVSGEGYGNFLYFENTGTSAPAFAAASSNPFGLDELGYASLPTFVDLDNDGDMDLLSGEGYGNFYYFQNTGTTSVPAFAAASSSPFGLTAGGFYGAPAFVDLDGDGDMDLLSGTSNGNFRYFENTTPAPELTADGTGFSFGNVGTGQTSDPMSLTVTNEGDANLTLDLSSFSGDLLNFALTLTIYDADDEVLDDDVNASEYVTLEPGQYVTFDGTFTPDGVGDFEASINFATNDADEGEFTINVSGTGVEEGPGGGGGGAIVIDEAYSTPGDGGPLTLDITLVNTTEDSVAGAQFDIDLSDMNNASRVGEALSSFLTDLAPAGFDLVINEVGEDTIRVVLFSANGSLIPPGNSPTLLGRLHFTPGSTVGTVDPIHIDPSSIRVSDPDGNLLSFGGDDGALRVIDLTLDLNSDTETDIRDIVLLISELVSRPGHELPVDDQSQAFQIRDGNDNELLEVGDAIAMVNKILRLPSVKAVAGGAPAGVSFGALTSLSDGRMALPVIVDGAGIAGLQASFTFDPAKVQIGAPVSLSAGLLLDSQTKDGVLNVIAISLNAQGLSAAGPSVFYLPVIFLAEDGLISLSALSLADRGANLVSLNPGVVGQTISKQGAAPKSFSLGGARPNPFNPSTGIAYEVPAQAHITLTVYNLLGQEIVTLVNQVQAAGRYEVTWNAPPVTHRGRRYPPVCICIGWLATRGIPKPNA